MVGWQPLWGPRREWGPGQLETTGEVSPHEAPPKESQRPHTEEGAGTRALPCVSHQLREQSLQALDPVGGLAVLPCPPQP